jgi:NAD-dependent deacetylase
MSVEPVPEPLCTALRQARSVVAFTGAGVSAESGVPTFRDAQTGQWAKFRPEELATPEAFRRHPQRVWEWYAARRAQVGQVSPNPAHYALVELERRVLKFLLATQNVDGLHHRAGSQRLVELHGNITRVKCFDENTPVSTWTDSGEVPPRCPRCGGWLRPDVVWFNELLPEGVFEESERAARNCDVFLSIGTSAVVYPAAALPLAALAAGAVVVEINPEETPLTDRASFFLQGKAGVILPDLVASVWPG